MAWTTGCLEQRWLWDTVAPKGVKKDLSWLWVSTSPLGVRTACSGMSQHVKEMLLKLWVQSFKERTHHTFMVPKHNSD